MGMASPEADVICTQMGKAWGQHPQDSHVLLWLGTLASLSAKGGDNVSPRCTAWTPTANSCLGVFAPTSHLLSVPQTEGFLPSFRLAPPHLPCLRLHLYPPMPLIFQDFPLP